MDGPVKVLWTGGWDSTFRICQLVLEKGALVRPYYVIESERRSSLQEIRAMASIRRTLSERDDRRGRLLETRFADKSEIPPHEASTARWRALRGRSELGPQYEWLSRFRRSWELDGLEISVHQDDRLYPLVRDAVEPCQTPYGITYRLPTSLAETDVGLLAGFDFPLLGWTKVEMESHARRRGFLDVLMGTWFCFLPLLGRPCGMCNPCRFAVAEGMGHRLSLGGRLRHRLRFLLFDAPRAVRRLSRRRAASAAGNGSR